MRPSPPQDVEERLRRGETGAYQSRLYVNRSPEDNVSPYEVRYHRDEGEGESEGCKDAQGLDQNCESAAAAGHGKQDHSRMRIIDFLSRLW